MGKASTLNEYLKFVSQLKKKMKQVYKVEMTKMIISVIKSKKSHVELLDALNEKINEILSASNGYEMCKFSLCDILKLSISSFKTNRLFIRLDHDKFCCLTINFDSIQIYLDDNKFTDHEISDQEINRFIEYVENFIALHEQQFNLSKYSEINFFEMLTNLDHNFVKIANYVKLIQSDHQDEFRENINSIRENFELILDLIGVKTS